MASKEGGTQRTICEFDDVDKVPWRRAGQVFKPDPDMQFFPRRPIVTAIQHNAILQAGELRL